MTKGHAIAWPFHFQGKGIEMSDHDVSALHLRPSTLADLAAVDMLLARSYPRLLAADYPPSIMVTAVPLISKAQPALLSSGTYYVVEEADHGIVGAGGWSADRTRRDLAHVRHVATDDRHLRRGIARMIVCHAIDMAAKSGRPVMECWSTRTAVGFYQSLGFRELGPIDVPLSPGLSFPSMRMIRP